MRPLREAKARGVDITGETCPHYLLLSADDYHAMAGIIRVNPPVREARNQEPLWAALADGTIDLIATDHAPHTPEEKTRNDIWAVDCGFPGVETQMPLMLTEVNNGRMSICDYVRKSAFNPAEIWGLVSAQGRDRAGLRRRYRDRRSRPRATSSPMPRCSRAQKSRHGTAARIKGLPLHTLVRGRFVMKDRTLVDGTRGWGRSVHTIQQCRRRVSQNTDLDDAGDRPCRRSWSTTA